MAVTRKREKLQETQDRKKAGFSGKNNIFQVRDGNSVPDDYNNFIFV